MATSLNTKKLNEREVNLFKGFRDFILRGNVMDLAVAVIIGAAFTAIVTALTADIINPLLGAFIGKPNFDYLVANVHGGKVLYGSFLTAIVNFLILAGVIYFFLVLPTQYLLKRFHPQKAEPPTTKTCPQCQSDVPVAATRCKFCTQPIS
jgi:large conductance mechanosensitive channel